MSLVEPRLRPRGSPNTLPEPLAVPEGVEWGPAMQALPSDRHRAFVLALYAVRPGHGAQVAAAKLAGFGTSTSSAKSWSVIASRLAGDDRIQAALAEEDHKRIRATAPRAVRALARLVETPGHRDHARAIGMVLDRVHPVETSHVVKVEDGRKTVVVSEEMIARILQLSRSVGIDAAKMPPMIDVTPTTETSCAQ
jgi:hypothetical protein